MNYFLSIAASDPSGGAGIQQDLKIAHDLGYWGLSAITGLTVQNFDTLYSVHAMDPLLLGSQIEVCLNSFAVSAVKIGAIGTLENAKIIANVLSKYSVKNMVLDPVLCSTSGEKLLDDSALDFLRETLFPLSQLVTPNKSEFEILCGYSIDSIDEGIEVAREKCKEWKTNILLKGGHFKNPILQEALITSGCIFRFERERKSFAYQHGTGCTLSTALACYLGGNRSLSDSYCLASKYLVAYYEGLKF